MTLIEAIKSGKRFRLKGEYGWPWIEKEDAKENSLTPKLFSPFEILSNDWEVEPSPIPLKFRAYISIGSPPPEGRVHLAYNDSDLPSTYLWMRAPWLDEP